MTLILSCATPEYAVQVSDRRLVLPNGSPVDDNANKTIFYNNHMFFSYTGLACIASTRKQEDKTDWWLTNLLAELSHLSISNAMQSLAEKATERFRRIPFYKEHKRLSIVGTGYVIPQGEAQFVPMTCLITNCQDQQGVLLPKAQDTFRVYARTLPQTELHNLLFSTAGQPVTEQDQLRRLLKNCAAHRVGPVPFAELLAREMRAVAERNPMVGHGMLIVSLPRQAVEAGRQSGVSQMVRISQEPLASNVPSCLYVSAGGRDVNHYYPHMAVGGCAMFGTVSMPL